ncbi:DUF2341 domain-containing protein [Thermococcus thermotolerans]|uniref:DUF2341 domain-containing protein n=1 Tax=Thermococcus thermotolerans TaxID=2969672 RepID=UPI0021585360|nr:DUF2341 domain-containing protein [Thermococcus thermotolerans]
MRRKLRITSIMLVLTLLLGTFGLAVPTITVNVQEIGTGANRLVSPVWEGRYTLWQSGTDVVAVELILTADMPAGTVVYVMLKNSSGVVVSNGTLVVGSGGIPAGTPFNVTVTPVNSAWVDPTQTEVIILSSDYNTDLSGPIFVNTQKLGLGTYDGSYSRPITVYGTSVFLDYYPIRMLFISSNPSFPWDSLYFTNTTGSCLYYWKEFNGTFVNSDGRTYSWAVFWVNVTNIPANSNETIFVNYLGTGNPCSAYVNPNKVFLFYDNFSSLANWQTGGTPTISGGELQLDRGDWILSTRSFPVPYSVEVFTNLAYDDGTPYDTRGGGFFSWVYSLGPFILPYVDSAGSGVGEGIGTEYLNWAGTLIPWGQQDGLVQADASSPITTLNWNYGDSNPPYIMGQWEILNATVTSTSVDFSQVLFLTWNGARWALSTTPSTGIPAYTQSTSSYTITVTSDGRILLGQWSGGPTRVDFVFVRKYVSPEPTYTLGNVYYHLTFVPEPPATSITGASVASTGIPTIAVIGKSAPVALPIGGQTSGGKTIPQLQNETDEVRGQSNTTERIKELARDANLTLPSNGP